ncbi:hypothetical protein B0H19DRAFT_1155934 [Mycena capillaripes]|nr:hypothetical protein B0H19DRAFT_1155934 [Mycena capillaripes]
MTPRRVDEDAGRARVVPASSAAGAWAGDVPLARAPGYSRRGHGQGRYSMVRRRERGSFLRGPTAGEGGKNRGRSSSLSSLASPRKRVLLIHYSPPSLTRLAFPSVPPSKTCADSYPRARPPYTMLLSRCPSFDTRHGLGPIYREDLIPFLCPCTSPKHALRAAAISVVRNTHFHIPRTRICHVRSALSLWLLRERGTIAGDPGVWRMGIEADTGR